MTKDFIYTANPKAQFTPHEIEIEKAIKKVLSSGFYILGEEVNLFEKEFASFTEVKFCIGAASGTDALMLALKATGIMPGDEVITVSHSAVATVAAIENISAVPVFADIEEKTRCIDPEKIIPLISEKTRAIVPVHIYGQPAPMNEIVSIGKKYNLKIIEDCAQAHGAEIKGKKVGTFGDASAFSFYPTKNLGGIGDGGAVVTNSAEIERNVREISQYGWRERYISYIQGMNSRLDEIQAAILRVKLPSLSKNNEKRRKIADLYTNSIKDNKITPPSDISGTLHAMHLYVIECEERNELENYFKSNNIGTSLHYPKAIHEQPAYQNRILGSNKLPVTEELYSKILTLPLYPELSDNHVERICSALSNWCKHS